MDSVRARRGQPRFVNAAERECASLLRFYGLRCEYEPRTFPLREAPDGRVLEAFTPDFYLPELDLYVEITTARQPLVTHKHRKLRLMALRHPDVRVKLLHRRDVLRLGQRAGLALAL